MSIYNWSPSNNPGIKTPLVASFSLGVVIHFSPLAGFWCQGSSFLLLLRISNEFRSRNGEHPFPWYALEELNFDFLLFQLFSFLFRVSFLLFLFVFQVFQLTCPKILPSAWQYQKQVPAGLVTISIYKIFLHHHFEAADRSAEKVEFKRGHFLKIK